MKEITEYIDETVHCLSQGNLIPSESNPVFQNLKLRLRWSELMGLVNITDLDDSEIEEFVCNILSNRKLFSVGKFWLCSLRWPSEDEVVGIVYQCSPAYNNQHDTSIFVWKPKIIS